MADRKWTEEQIQAINDRSDDLLVSAAAGSGKTAVLTERIINRILDKNDPVDISRILVVTFTKAAANELKERIAAALTRAMSADPTDKHLARQYVLLGKAHISTIDGFCLEIVKSNFEKLSIGADAHASDQTQMDLLMEQVAEYVIDNYYAKLDGYDDIENFSEFADNFITVKEDSALSEILISTYNSVCSYPRGTEFLLDSANEYKKALSEGFFATVWGNAAVSEAERKLQYFKKVISDGYDYCASDDVFADKYMPSFEYDLNYVSLLLSILKEKNIDKLESHLDSFEPITLGRVKSEDKTEESVFYASKRGELSKYVKAFRAEVSLYRGNEFEQSAKTCYSYTNSIYRFVKKFEERFNFEKRKRGLLDFCDIERLALKLLTDENGDPTPEAENIAADFEEIYIDEYQDVNKLQDMIFSAIAKNTPRFMVGDIKQSIYGFRGAEPSLFADYRRNDSVKKVYLTKNFRCSSPVIDFVNSVCGNLFRTVGTTVPYDKSDELSLGRDDTASDETELHIVEYDPESEDKNTAEAAFVAERISDMIKHGTNPKSIAILLRKTDGIGKIYENELSKRGVPCVNKAKEDLFVNPEILLVMDILNIVDNPTRDVSLAGALKSPVFNFSLSELVEIRSCSESGSLYDALVKYTEETGFSKGRYFLEKLSVYRSMTDQPVDKLLWFILCDTNMFTVAARDKSSVSSKKGNLLLLYEYARSFESGSFKGLYNFIRYIDDIINGNGNIPSASSEAVDSVSIITVHHSKGLEFPVVFLCNASGTANETFRKNPVLIERESGITMKLPDESGLASVNTVFRECACKRIFERQIDEEVRVLYVALTRAADKLIVTSCVKDAEKYLSNISAIANNYSSLSEPYFKFNDYMTWILLSSNGKYVPTVTKTSQDKDRVFAEENTAAASDISGENDLTDEKETDELYREYSKRFEFIYPGSAVSKIPAKFSVSELYPAILDEFDDSEKIAENGEKKMKVPSFISGEKAGAAERGTATHLFMQFCDFKRLNENGAENEIARLTDMKFIDSRIAGLIDRRAIARFTASRLYDDMLNSGFLKRELRFNIRLPASEFTSDDAKKAIFSEEKILVQGIIDCIFTDADGKLTLLDYKTDKMPYECMGDTEKFGEILVERHKRQLSYYFKAVSEIMRRKPDRVIIYSFDCGKEFEITDDKLILL